MNTSLRRACQHQIAELCGVLQQISDSDYTKLIPELGDKSISQHVRHVIEFYQIFLKACECGQLNYEKRDRNLLLEKDKPLAIHTLSSISEKFSLEFQHTNYQLEHTFLNAENRPISLTISTTQEREMIMLLEHTVHHLAILQIAITILGLERILPPFFGYADSTKIALQNVHSNVSSS